MSKTIKSLELDEISFVERPAQKPALATILKSENGQIAVNIAKRWIDPADGAVSFTEAFEASARQRAYWESQEIVSPAINALDTAMRAITGDADLPADEKQARCAQSAMDFLNTLRDLLPDVQDELLEAVEKASNPAGEPASVEGVNTMSDDSKQVATLQKELADLQKSLEVAEAVSKMSDAEKAYMAGLSDDDKEAFRKMTPEDRAAKVKKAADEDEVVTLKGETIRKSEVGASVFAVMKAQAEEMAELRKAQDAAKAEAAQVKLEKRASEEFGNLPGTAGEIAGVLKAIGDNEAGLNILKAANDALASVYVAKGVSDGQVTKGAQKLDALTKEIAKAEGISEAQAMVKALEQNPELYGESA